MKSKIRKLGIIVLLVQFSGCSLLTTGGLTPSHLLRVHQADASSASSDTNTGKIANPPAKTLRFDGHEVVLGDSASQSLDVDSLYELLQPLIGQQRYRSARELVDLHRETSERMLFERWATDGDDPVILFVSEVLSRRSSNQPTSWKSLLTVAKNQKSHSLQYLTLRNAFAEQLRISQPSEQAVEQLLQASLKVPHPIVRIDALRLVGMHELVADRHAWAESQFRQAIELSMSSGHPLLAADLWLTVCEGARRAGQISAAESAWHNAIELQLGQMSSDQPLAASFWAAAEETKPEMANWPSELAVALRPYVQQLGCQSDLVPDASLYAGLAKVQTMRGQMQTALVNFKRAENLAKGDNVQWLRIAQADCLANMGQTAAASAILAGPAASKNLSLSASAMATMGNIKLQAGAYQQGAQLLNKALAQKTSQPWAGHAKASADLAIAHLILGDTQSGLTALREAQQQLLSAGQIGLLIQSIENELKILEHEQLDAQLAAAQTKLAQLERS